MSIQKMTEIKILSVIFSYRYQFKFMAVNNYLSEQLIQNVCVKFVIIFGIVIFDQDFAYFFKNTKGPTPVEFRNRSLIA